MRIFLQGLAEAFKKLDVDDSGTVSKDEFYEVVLQRVAV